MTIHLPSPLAPTAVISTPPSNQNPDTQSNIATGTGPTFGPVVNSGIPIVQGNPVGGVQQTTLPPALICLSFGQASANVNPSNAMYAAGLTSVLAQMATGQLSHGGQLLIPTPSNYNGN